MPARLTPTQARDPEYVERLAAAEATYDAIMAGAPFPLRWWNGWQTLNEAEADKWRAKARELLTDLVKDTTDA